jgi:hypothetical protein
MPIFHGEGCRKKDPGLRRLWTALREIDRYLTSQGAWLIDYAERHRAGLRVGTSLTEGTANFLVNRRMNKSQQMRWSPVTRVDLWSVPSGLAPDPERRHRAALAESSGDSEHIAEGGDSLDMDRPSPGRRHVLLAPGGRSEEVAHFVMGPTEAEGTGMGLEASHRLVAPF